MGGGAGFVDAGEGAGMGSVVESTTNVFLLGS